MVSRPLWPSIITSRASAAVEATSAMRRRAPSPRDPESIPRRRASSPRRARPYKARSSTRPAAPAAPSAPRDSTDAEAGRCVFVERKKELFNLAGSETSALAEKGRQSCRCSVSASCFIAIQFGKEKPGGSIRSAGRGNSTCRNE